ncbi:hypothetical protein BAUCODRAFT_383373 [Baudoinia panamericana UAMH 10762]|uniref:Uncharacterized protein n=1 Tax=Baudoinia panamericana (strain UAMH 10762) TaxID=717646 RepID=M2NIG7_BAUPA|nr:uncharacterized protein BAUCODRAFT_383373 [Baudoinia panamericana UAMH 10762]EMC98885.1 hypothetical protein BAUCODRAFT_383373 [Baudoinia panamericana UAMH 10762]
MALLTSLRKMNHSILMFREMSRHRQSQLRRWKSRRVKMMSFYARASGRIPCRTKRKIMEHDGKREKVASLRLNQIKGALSGIEYKVVKISAPSKDWLGEESDGKAFSGKRSVCVCVALEVNEAEVKEMGGDRLTWVSKEHVLATKES